MYLAEATVGSNSCTEQQGCWQHTSKTISDSSCNGVYACSEFNGPDATIGLTTTGNFENGGSCQGFKSCEFARSIVGAAACKEQEACYNTGATLLHDGCCVGEFSCSSAFQTGQTCGTSIAGDVDPAASCIGYASCFNSQANIGAASCLGRLACYNVNASVSMSRIDVVLLMVLIKSIDSLTHAWIISSPPTLQAVGDGVCIGDFACERGFPSAQTVGTCSTAGLTPGQSCSGQGACNGAESVVGCNR